MSRSASMAEETKELLGLIQRKKPVTAILDGKNPLRIPRFCWALLLPSLIEQNPMIKLRFEQPAFWFLIISSEFQGFFKLKIHSRVKGNGPTEGQRNATSATQQLLHCISINRAHLWKRILQWKIMGERQIIHKLSYTGQRPAHYLINVWVPVFIM